MILRNNSEKGQAIVYLAIGMVVFLGFVALAIDGGMALADRRRSQNAADSASLAGGAEAALTLESKGIDYQNWNCNLYDINSAINNAEDTAITRAAANKFSIDHDSTDHNGVVASCGRTDYTWYGNKGDVYIDVTVDISATTKSNFAQLLFPTAMHNEVEAVTRVRPRQPTAFGNAIVALNPENCLGHQNGGIMYGNGDIDLSGGGVFSNGCLRGNGQPTVDITGGFPLGNELDPGNANWNPPPEEVDFQIPDSAYDVPIPKCAGHWVNSLDLLPNLLSGLYCINGDLKINASDRIQGTDVTIYVPNGKVDINGHAYLNISAPPPDSHPDPAIPGVLLYLPASNPRDVVINGTSDSVLTGLILAPRSTIQLNGTGGNTYVGQVVGWNVEVGGTANLFLTYDGNNVYNKPTSIELAK